MNIQTKVKPHHINIEQQNQQLFESVKHIKNQESRLAEFIKAKLKVAGKILLAELKNIAADYIINKFIDSGVIKEIRNEIKVIDKDLLDSISKRGSVVLFESVTGNNINNQKQIKDKVEEDLESFMKLTSKQFKFDSGFIMSSLTNTDLGGMIISLRHHFDNTSNIDEFIQSVSDFISVSETELTNNDIVRLTAHYERYIESLNK